jgi:hypothetical protein
MWRRACLPTSWRLRRTAARQTGQCRRKSLLGCGCRAWHHASTPLCPPVGGRRGHRSSRGYGRYTGALVHRGPLHRPCVVRTDAPGARTWTATLPVRRASPRALRWRGSLGDVLILPLDLRHGLGFQLLGTPVQANKQPLGGEERSSHEPNRRCIR